jgi:hypothetical protein
MEEKEHAYEILAGISEEKNPFRTPRHRRKVNIKMVLSEIVYECVDGISLASVLSAKNINVNLFAFEI